MMWLLITIVQFVLGSYRAGLKCGFRLVMKVKDFAVFGISYRFRIQHDEMKSECIFPDLKQIVCPVTEDEFMGHYFSKKFCHIPGDRSRFCHLLPWPVLNRILHE